MGAQGGLPFFYSPNAQGLPISQPITLAANATADSGPLAVEGIGFSKWAFQLSQVGATALSGYSVSIYGTISPLAYSAWQQKSSGTAGDAIVVPTTDWFLLPAPDEQTGTGISTNPIVATGVVLPYNLSPLVAVRAVVTADATPAGTLQVYYFGIP